ncbi:PA24B phospholipase, partial [Nothocercus nigrocapillus]|nr:PA24B phospholipase [Nothocercus nigrocapillus]
INLLNVLTLSLPFLHTVTLTDCYVTLWLPTASTEKVRTRTIRNSKNPVWNEAFCYKIDRRIKNVLELKVCDEDTVTRDDELCTVLFDIDKLTVGRTVRVKFQLNPQTHEELEVEFTLQNTVQKQHEPLQVVEGTGSRWTRWLRSLNIPLPSDFY